MFDVPDFSLLLTPTTPLLEIVFRGTITYLALFALLRLTLQRESGTVGVTNLLLVVLIADAAQNAMSGGYTSITDGILLVITIVFWSYGLDWLGYKVPRVGRLIHPPPLALVKGGRANLRNMRRELITHEELMTQLRLQGITELSEVEEAFMEGNGEISVVRKGESADQRRKGRTNR